MYPLSCVLLVDDDQTTNYLNQKLVKKLDITERVLVALNGQEALDILLAQGQEATPEQPILLFLDVNMPLMNGIEFLEDYQQLPLAQEDSIIIVLLTAALHPHYAQRAQQLRAVSLLSKPLTPDKITQVLEKHSARKSS